MEEDVLSVRLSVRPICKASPLVASRIKIGGGQAYGRPSDYTAIVAKATRNRA
jgi:hypothetical protein